MARTDPQLNFRCPEDLRDMLEAAAAENKRSLTAELIARLQHSFVPMDQRTAKERGNELLSREARSSDLVQLLARMERMLAQKDVDFEDLLQEVSPTILALTEGLPPRSRMPGDPKKRTVQWWRRGIEEDPHLPQDAEKIAAQTFARAERWIARLRDAKPEDYAAIALEYLPASAHVAFGGGSDTDAQKYGQVKELLQKSADESPPKRRRAKIDPNIK